MDRRNSGENTRTNRQFKLNFNQYVYAHKTHIVFVRFICLSRHFFHTLVLTGPVTWFPPSRFCEGLPSGSDAYPRNRWAHSMVLQPHLNKYASPTHPPTWVHPPTLDHYVHPALI